MCCNTSTASLDEDSASFLKHRHFALSLPSGLSSDTLFVPPLDSKPSTCATWDVVSFPIATLFNSNNLSFHFGSFRNIFQQCMKWNGSDASCILTASSIYMYNIVMWLEQCIKNLIKEHIEFTLSYSFFPLSFHYHYKKLG
jgi:hypothetical protein